MTIANLPAPLQDTIQQNFLLAEFQQGLVSTLAYRQIAEKIMFPNGRGETITKTRAGYKAPVSTALNPQTNTNLDNGLTPANYLDEQYTLAINMYADTIDLNLVTSMVTVVDFFLQNAYNNGKQAAQSLDVLALNAILNAYMGGNTYVYTSLGSPATTVQVNDIRGFQFVIVNGFPTPINGTNTMPVTINGNPYTLVGVAPDTVNVSNCQNIYNTLPTGQVVQTSGAGGISGELTFSTNVSDSDATLGNPVISAFAPTILRPNARSSTYSLTSGDILTMQLILDAVAVMRDNAVPDIDGKYHLYLDNTSLNQLYADPVFQLLYRGRSLADPVYLNADIVEGLDVRFIRTTQAPQQQQFAITEGSSPRVHRPILCGADVLVEGTFAGQDAAITQLGGGMLHHFDIVESVVHTIRSPLDRLGQIISQSWFWIGGYVAPTDSTATNYVIPTANNAYYKRAIVFETL